MQELNDNQVCRVAGGIYQPEPWDTSAGVHRNPLYMYLDATASQQDLTSVKVVAL
jgi:hypothetical protein